MEAEIENNGLRWYAVYTKPGEEDRAESNLKIGRIETFTPRMKARRAAPFTGDTAFVVKPLFPRYLFARFKASETLHKVWFTRGVHSVVSIGNQPAPVDDEVIEIIRSRRGEDDLIRVGEEFSAGDRVTINDGPFKNLEGIFDGTAKDSDRVFILLSAVSYQSHVVVERSSVKKSTGKKTTAFQGSGFRPTELARARAVGA